jgi:hypothetical protein
MTFENECTISVQFGRVNYASIVGGVSISAEIAIWDKDGNWYKFGNDQVKGHCNANEVAEWINRVSKFNHFDISVHEPFYSSIH